MSDADDAYAAALSEIARVKAAGRTQLYLNYEPYRALTTLPPQIADIPGLAWVDLDNTQVSDLTPLAGLTGLTILHLTWSRVTDLTPLAGMTGLTNLYLSQTGVTDLTPLAGMTGLTGLYFSQTGVTDLTPLAGLTELTSLSLSQTGVTDLTPLAGLTELTSLTLSQTGVTDLTPLAGLTGLTVLYLDQTGVTDLTPLVGLTELTSLSLDQTGVTDLTPLAELTELTSLSLSRTRVTNLTPLAGLTGLMRLSLDQTRVTDLSPLAGLTGLMRLSLNQTGVTDLSPLAGLTRLSYLFLNRTGVADVTPLKGLTALLTLNLNNTKVADLSPLRDCSKLGKTDTSGLFFTETPAERDLETKFRLPPRRHHRKRTAATLAYLASLDVPDLVDDDLDSLDVTIPKPILAPLQIEERDGRLRPIMPGDALEDAGRVLAREGWEALRESLADLADLRPRIVNQTPMLARALSRFETALGHSYENARPIAMGTHGQHVIAQAGVAVETMDTGDATALRSFAVAVGIFLERFPEWRDYRDAAPLPPVDPAKAAEALAQIDSVANEAAKHPDEIAPEIAQSLKDQVSAVRDVPDDPVARRGMLDSAQNFLSEAARVVFRRIKAETIDIVKVGWTGVKKRLATALELAVWDILLNQANILRNP